jgi:hypothetical protein
MSERVKIYWSHKPSQETIDEIMESLSYDNFLDYFAIQTGKELAQINEVLELLRKDNNNE